MSRAGPGRYFSRTVQEDESVLAYAKYVARQNAAGTDVTAATIQVQANSLLFTVNGAAETVIGTYTGNSGADNEIVYADANILSIQGLVDAINGFAPGYTAFNRWKAAIGDFRPGWVLGAGDGVAAGAANALLGEDHDGLTILGDSSNLATASTFSVAIGAGTTERGTWPQHPDHAESDYSSTILGVITRQRSSAARRREEQPISETQVLITNIHCGQAHATNDKRIRVYDKDDNVVWVYRLAALDQPPTNVLSEDQPIEGPMGSPLWVELDGTGGLTDGPMTVSGYILAA